MSETISYGHATNILKCYRDARSQDSTTEWGKFAIDNESCILAWRILVIAEVAKGRLPLATVQELDDFSDLYDYNPFDQISGWRE